MLYNLFNIQPLSIMSILTDNLQKVEQQFGEPVMAQNLINGTDVFKGEKAYEYSVGDFRMIAGFYGEICRYVCFRKAPLGEPLFTPEDVEVCLMLIAPMSAWKDSSDEKKPTATASESKSSHPVTIIGSNGLTTDYQCTIKDSGGNETGVLGWHCSRKSYFFAYCPALPFPQPAIAVSPTQVDGKFD